MKKILILISLVVGCTPKPTEFDGIKQWSAVELLRNQHKDELSEWEILQLAVMLKESRFNPNAVGSCDDRGVYQITRPYLNEVNRLSEKNYTHDDAFDIAKSIEMFAIVQGRYNKDKDIHEAIKHHNPGAGAGYEREILRNMQTIRQYEEIRKLLLAYGK